MKTQSMERLREELKSYRDERIVVGEDPSYDINQVWNTRAWSIKQEERLNSAFFAAWERALRSVARTLGLRNVKGIRTVYDSAHENARTTIHYKEERIRHGALDDEPLENTLWRMAHDRMTLPAALRGGRGR